MDGRDHSSARATSPFSAASRGIHTHGGGGLGVDAAWRGEGEQRGKPRAFHDEYGTASGPLGTARERSVTPGQGTMRVSQLQESRQESRHRAAFERRGVETRPQHAANRPSDAAGGGGGGGDDGRAARAGGERGGHDYRNWLSALGDEQLRAIRASLQRASDVPMDTLPSHQLLEGGQGIHGHVFDSPTAAGHADNWVPEVSSPTLLGRGGELLPSPIRLAATVFPATHHRQQGLQRQEHASAPGGIPGGGSSSNGWRAAADPGGDALKNLANCVAAHEDIRAMLETGKRDGELALLSRSEEINRQMEAALALQKALLGSVEAMTEETLDLRSRLSEAEASCSRLEQERDWLQQRLNHIQLAGARLVVNGLDHVSLRTQVWALQRWYQTARSERRERDTFAHLKKIALSRLMAGRRYQRALLAWRAVAHAKRAVVHSLAASNRARTRVAVVRRCYSQWRDGLHELRAMARKLFIGSVGVSFRAWAKWHVTHKAKRRAEAVSTRKAVAKLMKRILQGVFLQWAQGTVNRRESLNQKLTLMIQRSGLAASGANASTSAVRGHYFSTWKHRYLYKKRNADIVRRLAAPRRLGTLRVCFDSVTCELIIRRKTKRATFKVYSRLMRAVLRKWADYCVWDVAVQRPIRLASAHTRPHTRARTRNTMRILCAVVSPSTH